MTSTIRIITGGQAGADQGAARAARIAGVKTGGWAQRGWLTEDGPRPWLLRDCFEMEEHPSDDPRERTRANCELADAGLWFGDPDSPGGKLTRRLWREFRVPFVVVSNDSPAVVADWLERHVFPVTREPVVLHAAGNRESKTPGIGDAVECFMLEVFRLLSGADNLVQ